jgi:D-arabinose 1-dehydrogenase-like Zn-dependent alcohol dehydrogenase
MALVKDAKIKPVIYTEAYRGLGELPRAMEDLKARRVYGRAVLRIDEKAEVEAAEKAKL